MFKRCSKCGTTHPYDWNESYCKYCNQANCIVRVEKN